MAEKKQGKKPSSGERVTKKYEKKKYCPKCGAGTNLGEHSNRLSCGKCGYMEKTTTGTQRTG